jgi:SAM-dependent methyltransferase
MPYLLQDLWAMGCSLELILNAINELNLNSDNTEVLDLGCGKGALSVKVADRFGYKVVGIDAMEEFLDFARKKAEELDVAKLCRFINFDMHHYINEGHQYDIVLLASLGGILGSLSETVTKLRSQVKDNGFIIIDDGYLKNSDHSQRNGYLHYRNRWNSIAELESAGDLIIAEHNTDKISREINIEYLEAIRVRAAELISKYPDMKKEIEAYLELQEEECKVIERDITGALWVIQKKKPVN